MIKLKKKKNHLKKRSIIFVVGGVLMGIHVLSLMLPFIWMLLTSFKGLLDFQESFLGLPEVWHFENYSNVFKLMKVEVLRNGQLVRFGVFDMLVNSILLAVLKPFFSVLSVALMSYAVASYEFVGKKFWFNVNIFVMIIPIVGSLANTLVIYKNFHIYNNLLLYVILPGGPFGFNFLLLYGVFKGIPKSYSEAVFIDGGGHFTVMFKVIIPLVVPTLVTLYILGFIGMWNDYNSSLIYLPSVPNLAYGLYMYQYDAAKYGAILPEILAAFVVCSLPSVALYVSSQKLISSSLMMGGLKE